MTLDLGPMSRARRGSTTASGITTIRIRMVRAAAMRSQPRRVGLRCRKRPLNLVARSSSISLLVAVVMVSSEDVHGQ